MNFCCEVVFNVEFLIFTLTITGCIIPNNTIPAFSGAITLVQSIEPQDQYEGLPDVNIENIETDS